MAPVLETRKLCKSFGALTVADNIDFRLEPGARHALIGPNGAGKTTFVNMLMGALSPSSGEIWLAGEEVTRAPQSARVRRGLGRTFQITTLFRNLPVLDNVALGIAERDGTATRIWRPASSHREIIEEARSLLAGLGLADDAPHSRRGPPLRQAAPGRDRDRARAAPEGAAAGRAGRGRALARVGDHSLEPRKAAVRYRDPHHRPVYERSKLGIGYVPQEREIFPSLSLEENLLVAARPGRWNLARVYELFPRLKQRKAARGNQLSGGEQQMLAIGRALMGNPSLLLMDEPLEGLAPIIVEALLISLRKLASEDSLALVLVEQHAKLALEVTASAIVLNRGRVSYSGPSRELLADPQRLAALVLTQ
jgi:branched-chain amino acid transport system ATP-binding protein